MNKPKLNLPSVRVRNFFSSVFLSCRSFFSIHLLDSRGKVNSMTYVILIQIALIAFQLFWLSYSVYSSIQN